MPRAKTTASEIDLSSPQYYFNRELSWLEFNRRVLQEALDPRTPLLERVKFAAIFASNLDEFFMVRVAVLKDQVAAEVSTLTPDGRTAQQQLDEISQCLHPMVERVLNCLETELIPQLAAEGIYLLRYSALNKEQRLFLQRYFEERVFPVLTPLAVDPSHPFPVMSNLSLNLAVVVKDPVTGQESFARVKVPVGPLPRFVQFPCEMHLHNGQPCVWAGVFLEEVIAHNLDALFPGMTIQDHHVFRITRDADLEVREDEAEDLLLAIQQELRKRRFGGSVVRLQIPESTSDFVRQTLMKGMNLSENDVYRMNGALGLKDLFALTGIPLPHLKDPPFTPVIPPRLRRLADFPDTDLVGEEGLDIFTIIRQGDLLVHHPYESFTASVEYFVTQAAHDPDVLAIKMTLYRTSGDSPIIQALIAAAENGKQVAALVELKARFDEESNITWARALENAGVHVVYGVLGLKTHTKVVLVVRQEAGQLRRYVHIGTGNYNPKTARIYTDLGLLSCREELGADLTDLFNYLTGFSKQKSYRKLLVAPVTLRDRLVALIRREMAEGRNGHIIAKMNALVDPQIIRTLYEASQAGVQVDLIVRGICCLRPGIAGVSENIRVISIVGRYLEHSRIFWFSNNGEPEVFIGSADWMPRNLDRRVEAVTPIDDPTIAAKLKQLLDIFLADNRQAWELRSDGTYVQRHPTEDDPERSAQTILMEMALHQ
ncbi:polyphosphate kinase 1 [Leptothermofonsia sichuanensis E412]|uniref:polyphosphate kinase 1 n=1 Tax=Leptothermofonsia sichuanensis TaxID=2917832 RepID=UPI001CA76D7A|nr:polyphosphate kinase 1 [Leptothermofonsia sichuanensis]QZZ20991.1 polyphosphate kinase 1 [Leptothermofonsia sichuanensis E412]